MKKYIFKKLFSSENKSKLEQARKRALETYDKMLNEQKIKINKNLEQNILSNKKNNNDNNSVVPDLNSYKSEETNKRIEDIVTNFKFVNTNKSQNQEKLNISTAFNKIENEVLHYKLNLLFKNKKEILLNEEINQNETWINMYELVQDKGLEKFKKMFILLLKILVIYKTYSYIKKYFYEKKEIKIRNYFFILGFYGFFIGLYFVNKSYDKRTITKLLIRDEKLRIFTEMGKLYQNKLFQTKQIKPYFDTDLINLFAIHERNNSHEIYYFNNKRKVGQLFLFKNAIYDLNLLKSICHPNVRKVKFTNLE